MILPGSVAKNMAKRKRPKKMEKKNSVNVRTIFKKRKIELFKTGIETIWKRYESQS